MAKNKTEQEIRSELEHKKTETFLKEYEEAYAQYIQPINKKYQLRLIPVILGNKVGGLNPGYGLETYIVEEVTPQDPDVATPNESEKPETN